ncbi:hypothetical protein D9758_008773 [Tetrapyrgos nigripes]|uniref:AMP-dependent synthetase/ligase domain-containing protein n=1 Tax=Tetrapyrgos nigripes TaxID=182062 RepID=A0A8H5FY81_9AGAR|nr:hypothetical protein D9758_008773 [Tetrapyrgos nigripes]
MFSQLFSEVSILFKRGTGIIPPPKDFVEELPDTLASILSRISSSSSRLSKMKFNVERAQVHLFKDAFARHGQPSIASTGLLFPTVTRLAVGPYNEFIVQHCPNIRHLSDVPYNVWHGQIGDVRVHVMNLIEEAQKIENLESFVVRETLTGDLMNALYSSIPRIKTLAILRHCIFHMSFEDFVSIHLSRFHHLRMLCIPDVSNLGVGYNPPRWGLVKYRPDADEILKRMNEEGQQARERVARAIFDTCPWLKELWFEDCVREYNSQCIHGLTRHSHMLRRYISTLRVSSVQGPTHPPLDHRTLPAYFTQHILANFADRPALTCPHELPTPHSLSTRHLSWTFSHFDNHISALSRGLISLGVRPGDRVAVIMPNNSAYALLQWALSRIGAILVTINPAYRINELVQTLDLVGTKHLVVVPGIRTSRYLDMLVQRFPEIVGQSPGEIHLQGLSTLRNLVVVGGSHLKPALDWRDVFLWRQDTKEKAIVDDLAKSLHKDDVWDHGAPKAVSLTHHNLLNNARFIAMCMDLSEKDVLCNVPPLFHCFGLILGNLAAWVQGGMLDFSKGGSESEQVQVTALHGVPTHFLGVLEEVSRRRARGDKVETPMLRTGIAAGSSVPIQLMRRLINELGLEELTNAYGMTETSPVSFQTRTTSASAKEREREGGLGGHYDSMFEPFDMIQRTETVGRVHPHVKMVVVDSGWGAELNEPSSTSKSKDIPIPTPLPINTPGEVLISGYLLQKGYWGDSEQTKKAMKTDVQGTRWMFTGDEGVLGEDGCLRIVSRIKDLIIRGGENLFPIQIEDTLLGKLGGSDGKVRECAVVAVKDEKYGEVVGVWVVAAEGVRVNLDVVEDKAENLGDNDGGKTLSRKEIRDVIAKNMNPQNAPAWVWFVGSEGGEGGGYLGDGPIESLVGNSNSNSASSSSPLGYPTELPKTASGKVMKHVLREWSEELVRRGVGRVG